MPPIIGWGKDRGANDAMTLAGCWAHARRKFFDLHAQRWLAL